MKSSALIILFGGLTWFALPAATAQVSTGTPGISILKGTTFYADGLSFKPASDLSLTNLKLERQSIPVSWPDQAGLSRVHSLSRPVSFHGSVAMRYNDNELNGNHPERLRLAYSGLTFNTDPAKFSIGVTSVSQVLSKSVGQVILSPVDLAVVTAVSPGPGSDILQASNIVSPDGDGINDVWTIRGIENYPLNELRIFDREGRVLYTTTGYKNTWDAKVNGNPLPEDTYYYILYLNPGQEKITGFISVVRKN